MCGIAGLIAATRAATDIISRMSGALIHRGPDDQGTWVDADARVGLAHRRLSIIDLSSAGHEPMHSSSGRFIITFNGEIYNYRDLRKQLDRLNSIPSGGWRGHSDVEVFLQLIETWGIEAAIRSAVGMFAFALWDCRERSLRLARDRFGEKPLYYGWVGQDFVFASELKAIASHPRFEPDVDREALSLFASRTYIPAPLSIYRRIFKLPPGCVLTVPVELARAPLDAPPAEGEKGQLKLERYWSYRDVVRKGLAHPIHDEHEALQELDSALSRAVADQSIADVPVGMFLSGGIDSSTIAALYQRSSNQPVRTFSIGFEDQRYNEAPFASIVAEQLGTIHHEQIVTEKDALATIPLLPTIYDEPFGDSSQIPTFLVSRLARSEVKVVLTGDGGDELFGGYYRHFYAPRFWRAVNRVPRPVRGLGAPLSRIPTEFWSRAGSLFPGHGRVNIGPKIQKALRVSAIARNMNDVYASFLDEWGFEKHPVRGMNGRSDIWDLALGAGVPDEVRIMYCDAVSYLPDDILCKVDRASMAVSLETRVPFLDHRVAELAARMPLSMKVRGGKGKHILRELLFRQAPRQLFDRPKAGFGIPVGEWLKGPLRSWAEDLLEPRRMDSEGCLDASLVQRRWNMHLSGRRDSTPALWAILMFQAWRRHQTESRGAIA
jgi:asparagine synthase (glutamine-hydrolysing)